jgi:hypothetical protein
VASNSSIMAAEGGPGNLAATPKKLMMRPISGCKLSSFAPLPLAVPLASLRHRPVACVTPAEEGQHQMSLLQCRYRILALQWQGYVAWQRLLSPQSAAVLAHLQHHACLSMLACMAA